MSRALRIQYPMRDLSSAFAAGSDHRPALGRHAHVITTANLSQRRPGVEREGQRTGGQHFSLFPGSEDPAALQHQHMGERRHDFFDVMRDQHERG